MSGIRFMMMPCKRCGKNHSILKELVWGEDLKNILNSIEDTCPQCLTHEEKRFILAKQLQDITIHMERSGGGTGVCKEIRIFERLCEYLGVKPHHSE